MRTTTVGELIEGFIDNMSQNQIDEELRFFEKVSRKLKGSRGDYGNLGIIIDEDWQINERFRTEMAEILGYEPYSEKNEPSGFQFLYFRNKEDADICDKTAEERQESEP